MPDPAGPPARDYLIEEYTTTLCPACFAERPRRADDPDVFIDGMLVRHDHQIWLRRFCPTHGESESLYEEDADLWAARKPWRTPTLQVTPDRPVSRGFPAGYRDGLPVSHGQHTCILLLNVTDRCNYRCPTCYASAQAPGTPVPVNEHPSIDAILKTVRVMLAREQGKLGVVMLSGGEPTVRDDLAELIPRLFELNITRIMVNTNGRRVAKDDRLVKLLHRFRDRVEVYLQYDGLAPEASVALRGEDLVAEKLAALKRLDDAGVWCTLVATIATGINDDQLGGIVRLGLNTPHCTGLALQPVFGSGRGRPIDPRDRATPTGVLRRLGEQTAGVLGPDDFIPLPCSHPDCCDISYLLRGDDGQWRSLPKLVGREELLRWIHLIGNTITFDDLKLPVVDLIRSGAVQRVLSQQLPVAGEQLQRDLGAMCDCIPDLFRRLGGVWTGGGKPEAMAERTFRVTVKMFMDADTFHAARLRQCCVHTGTFEADPRRYSFCWRWLFADASDFPDGRLGGGELG